jgi:acetyl esterase/lipase
MNPMIPHPAGVLLALMIAPSLLWSAPTNQAPVRVVRDVSYKTGSGLTVYESERCKLDIFSTSATQAKPVLIWFHGGALKAGDKSDGHAIAASLAAPGLVVVTPNYRLSPDVRYPAYVQDAAASVAWVQDHIRAYGGDPEKLFVGGHSAGAWLALMIGLDERYLASHELRPSDLAGLIPVSGQTMTHFTVREERGIGQYTITADAAAPVHHVRKDSPPMLLLYADNDLVARAEENEYFVAVMKGAGNDGVVGLKITDRDHGTVAFRIAKEGDPGRDAVLNFMREISGEDAADTGEPKRP